MRQPTGIDRTIALGMLGAGALVGVAAAAPAASAETAGPATPQTTASAYQAQTYQTHTYHTEMFQKQWSRIGRVKLYPLAGAAVDPLSNSMATDLSGLPISTAPINAMFADGLPVRDLPLVGGVLAPPAAPSGGTDADDDESHPASGLAAPAAVAAPAAPVAVQGPLFGPLH